MKSQQQQRLREFEQRADYSPDAVFQHRSFGWRYVPVHDLSDDASSEHTMSADCWCLLGSNAALLECLAAGASQFPPGYYFRRDTSEPHWPKLFAVLSVPTITRAAADDAMQHFQCGVPLSNLGTPR